MPKFTTVSTKAGDFEYPIEYREFESLDEYREAAEERGENPDEAILGLINAAQKQGATQGQKQAVRDALEADDEDALEQAVSKHQASAREYIVGAPRGTRTTGGNTKKKQREFGERVTQAMVEKGGALTQQELDELREELGIVV